MKVIEAAYNEAKAFSDNYLALHSIHPTTRAIIEAYEAAREHALDRIVEEPAVEPDRGMDNPYVKMYRIDQ